MATLGLIVLGVLFLVGMFFFTLTRGTLIVRNIFRASSDGSAHVYPIYSNMRFIKLVDFQPIISAILLFQYEKLVDRIVREIHETDLAGKKTLITSCAFGNVIPRVTEALVSRGISRVFIVDIIRNELIHAEGKLGVLAPHALFVEEDATNMAFRDGSVDQNIMFFLLHELPHELKIKALVEAGRVLTPGGKLILAEFHRPQILPLRILSYIYFKVFEPFGLALWDEYDPVRILCRTGKWSCERETFFFGNFQVIVATKRL